MAVGGFGWDEAKKSAKLLLVTNGTWDDIKTDFEGRKDLVGYFTININDIIRRLRAKAQAAGIDLGRAFFFPPDDPRFDQILTQVKRERDGRLARLRGGKKRSALAKRRRRQENIDEPQRFRADKYPPVMRGIATSSMAR
jgi:hypothetical protein